MKRAKGLFEKIISDENLSLAIDEVNRTHHWRPHHKPNKAVKWVESNKEKCIEELRRIITEGFKPSPCILKRRWDKSADKWRNIHEPKLYPDQYIHHALIQVLQPVMLKQMDYWVCGSIRGRGIHYGLKGLKKWNYDDLKGTKYCAELDIHHFYESITSKIVIGRMKQLIKDRRTLDLIERIIREGVMIGSYCSQWFANTLLQPLDKLIRENGATHYIRYMDNFTIFASSKRTLRKIKIIIECWLSEHGMELKENWQIFPTMARKVSALGYSIGHGYTLLRKKNCLRLSRQLHRFYKKSKRKLEIPINFAFGLMSRIGQLSHCNSLHFRKKYVRVGTQRKLKNIIREFSRRMDKWNMSLVKQLNSEFLQKTLKLSVMSPPN